MFRLLNVSGRAALEVDGRWYDLARLSGDESLADPMAAVARSAELHALSARCADATPDGAVADASLEAPVPRPRQVFAIGINYADHAAESGIQAPPAPLTFTKFPSSIAGPTADVPLSGEMVDWEVEVVVVIGRTCAYVPVEEAWGVVAGLTLGQDISDRKVQMTGTPPQFSLGKSFPSYAPIGPAMVSVDGLADPMDLGPVVRRIRRADAGEPDEPPHLRHPHAGRLPVLDLHRLRRATSSSPARPTGWAWPGAASWWRGT